MEFSLNKHGSQKLKNGPNLRKLTSALFILIVVSGVMSAMFTAISVDLRGRDYLKGRSQTIANSLSAENIGFLEGNSSDTTKFEYTKTKSTLEKLRSNNPDLSSMFLLKLDNEPVFLASTTMSDGTNFGNPGDKYVQQTNKLLGGFSSSEPFVEGPVKDDNGIWLTAFSPVVNPKTGQTIALLGIETSAINYYFEVAVYALVPLCLAAIPVAGLLRDRKLYIKEWEMTQLKNQFVSIASHELRSPLTGMLWAIQLLIKNGDNLNPKQKSMLNNMYKSAEASTTTINEILDLSVFERGKNNKDSFATADIVPALHDIQKTLALGAQEKDLSITLDKSIPLAAMTFGDISAIKRAMMNLVSNSIKYAYDGTTITISYKTDNNLHIFSVSDKGIGIPKSEQEKVLQGYYRAENAHEVQAHGTGLGLWIARLIVEEHGGKIWLESEQNKGTTIFVALPKVAAKIGREQSSPEKKSAR